MLVALPNDIAVYFVRNNIGIVSVYKLCNIEKLFLCSYTTGGVVGAHIINMRAPSLKDASR